MNVFGRIPSGGERIDRDGVEFTIESVKDQRITSVRIIKSDQVDPEEEEG